MRPCTSMIIVVVALATNIQALWAQDETPSAGLLEYKGVVEPVRAADISPRFDGLLTKIHFQAGDIVKKGDLLFEFLTLEQELLRKIDQANLSRAEAQLKLAEARLKRSRTLQEKNVTSEADLEAAAAERDIARANVSAARTTVEMKDIIIGEFSLYAPFDGIISEPYVNEGVYITKQSRADSSLATVTLLDPIRVSGKVPFQVFADRRKLLPTDAEAKTGTLLSLIMPDGEAYPHWGEYASGGQQVDEATQKIVANSVFPNPDLLLRPGLRVTVHSRLKPADQ